MPSPQQVLVKSGEFKLPAELSVSIQGPLDHRVEKALSRLELGLGRAVTSLRSEPGHVADLVLNYTIASPRYPTIEDDESYMLDVSANGLTLQAPSSLGILRGLATVEQLALEGRGNGRIPALSIRDAPRYPWRGLLLDVVRHWLPKAAVKRTIDAMAAVKMNVLHLHLTDDQGFRIESKVFPKLHEQGSDGNYYSHAEIREIVDYAADRGIRVVPEFDMPAHTTSWLVAYPELASAPGPYVIERRWGTLFEPVLNPASEQVYDFISALLEEMSELFPDRYVHIGGDEVLTAHWEENPDIQAYMKAQGLPDAGALHNHFNQKVISILRAFGKTAIAWNEALHPEMTPEAAIQVWDNEEDLLAAVSRGHQSIRSYGFYLDHQMPAAFHHQVDVESGTRQQPVIADSVWENWQYQFEYDGKPRSGELLLFGSGPVPRGRIRLNRSSAPYDIYFSSARRTAAGLVVDVSSDLTTGGQFQFRFDGNRLEGTGWIRGFEIRMTGTKVGDAQTGDAMPELPSHRSMTEEQRAFLLGGEACMWTEYVTDQTLDSRLWPRTAAIAEVLWSASVEPGQTDNLYRRLEQVSTQLEALGLTHNSYRQDLLRAAFDTNDVDLLSQLTRILEPVKFYRRQRIQDHLTTQDPLEFLADAVAPESTTARSFAREVSKFLNEPVRGVPYQQLRTRMTHWRRIAEALQETRFSEPSQQQIIASLSDYLARLASAGIRALDRVAGKADRTACSSEEAEWFGRMEVVAGSVELAILDPVKALIEAGCSADGHSDRGGQ